MPPFSLTIRIPSRLQNSSLLSRWAFAEAPLGYFLPSDALISGTVVRWSGLRLRIDMTSSGSRCTRPMLSTNTIVPITGGFGTGSFDGGRLNMSA